MSKIIKKYLPIENGDPLILVIWKIMQNGSWYNVSELWEIIKEFGFNKELLLFTMMKYNKDKGWFIIQMRENRAPIIRGVKRNSKHYKLKKSIPMPIVRDYGFYKYRAIVNDNIDYSYIFNKDKTTKRHYESLGLVYKPRKTNVREPELRIDHLLAKPQSNRSVYRNV